MKYIIFFLIIFIIICIQYASYCKGKHEHEHFISNVKVPPFTAISTLIHPDRDMYPLDAADVVPLFWTGGLFSTYRLCDLVIRQKRRVRPIYIIPTGLDKRQTALNEIKSMKNIRRIIDNDFPILKNLLLDTYMLSIQPVHEEIRRQTDVIFGRSATRLYGAFSQASYILLPKHPIEWVLSEYTPQYRLRGHIVGIIPSKNKTKCIYEGKKSTNNLFAELYKHVIFILPSSTCKKGLQMTKKNAIKYGFFNVLKKNTWTCWFPQKRIVKDGSPILTNPCGVCSQCIARQTWFN